MNENYTDLNIIQDKSGSMAGLRDETIQGFNTFIEDQRKLPSTCLVTLMQFDTNFTMLYNGEDIKTVKPLDHSTYAPNGYTALLDAIGRTITTTGQRLEAMPEADRPAKVVMVIITDGEENSSKEFAGADGRAKIMDMIKHQTESYKWNFIFLGANQDAIQAGHGIGVSAGNAMSYAANAKGVSAAYAATSSNLRGYRTSGDAACLCFAGDQRAAQFDAGAAADALNTTKDTGAAHKKPASKS